MGRFRSAALVAIALALAAMAIWGGVTELPDHAHFQRSAVLIGTFTRILVALVCLIMAGHVQDSDS